MSELINEDTRTMHEKLRVAVRCKAQPKGVPVKFAASKYKSHSMSSNIKFGLNYKYKLYERHGLLYQHADDTMLSIKVPLETQSEKGILLDAAIRVYANGQSIYGINCIGTFNHIYQWWFADEKTPKLPRVVIK